MGGKSKNGHRKHYKLLADLARAKREEERIKTLEMLLGAKWYGEYFVKRDTGVSPDGLAWHWNVYYDRDGKEIPKPKAPDLAEMSGIANRQGKVETVKWVKAYGE